MNKKILMIAFALLMSTVLFSACNRNESRIDKPTVQNKTTAQEPTAEKKTEKEATTEPPCVIPETEKTDVPTDPVSDPTRVSTTCHPDGSINFLYKPEQIIFYHNGKPQTIAKDNVMCDEVIKIINKSTKNDKWGILKLAIEEGYIEEIKNENLCIEIYYNDMQVLSGFRGHTLNEYNFERLLIVLDKNSHGLDNTIFFFKDGKYQHGPIRAYSSDLSQEVLAYIFD